MPILRSSSRSTMAYSVSYASTQHQLPSKSQAASTGTSLVTAAKAIGMPKLKATPSTACGMDTYRLANG